jgi:hypothetical protein
VIFVGSSVWGVSSRLQEISSSSSAEVEKRFKLFGFKDMGGECLFQGWGFSVVCTKEA